MGDSKIEWTEKTWNPVVGCTKVSPGCAHCYAETMANRLKAMALQDIATGKDPGRKRHYIDAIDDRGRWSGKMIPVPEALDDPLDWKKPKMIFVNSMSDLFHEDLPFEFIDRVFATMYGAQWHTFQILTKRPDRMLAYLRSDPVPRIGTWALQQWTRREPAKASQGVLTNLDMVDDVSQLWPLPNVWLGTSCERQQEADERIPHLRNCPAAVRFLSIEPLLGPMQIDEIGTLNWIIVGGESGHDARPMHPDWVRSLRDQCLVAGVPFFFKQWGEFLCLPIDESKENAHIFCIDRDGHEVVLSHRDDDGWWRLDPDQWRNIGQLPKGLLDTFKVGKKTAGRELDGFEWNEMPRVESEVDPQCQP